MIDQTLTFRLCGTEVLAACCWSHGLPPCGSGSYIEGECVLRSGSFTFATFNFTVSGLVLLPFVGSVPAVSGFIWLNHFSFLAVLYPFCPLLCCRPPHLSNYPHICHLWPLLPHLCLINSPLPPVLQFLPYFWDIFIILCFVWNVTRSLTTASPETVSLKWTVLSENCRTPPSNLVSCCSLMSQSPICAFISPLFTESINPDHISDCWIFKWTLSMRSPSQTN